MIIHESKTSESATSFSDFIRDIATDPAHKDAFEKCFSFYVPSERSYDDARISIKTGYPLRILCKPCYLLGYDKPSSIVKLDWKNVDKKLRTMEITEKQVGKFRKLYDTFVVNYASAIAKENDRGAFNSFLKLYGLKNIGNKLKRGTFSVFGKMDGTVGIKYDGISVFPGADPLELSIDFAEDARLLAIAKEKYEGLRYR